MTIPIDVYIFNIINLNLKKKIIIFFTFVHAHK